MKRKFKNDFWNNDKVNKILFSFSVIILLFSENSSGQHNKYDVWIKPHGQQELKVDLEKMTANEILFSFSRGGELFKNQEIEFSEIEELSYRRKHQVRSGQVYGAIIGAGTGVLFGKLLEEGGTCKNNIIDLCAITKIVTGVGFGIIGLIVGESVSNNKIRLGFSGNSERQKIQRDKIKKDLNLLY